MLRTKFLQQICNMEEPRLHILGQSKQFCFRIGIQAFDRSCHDIAILLYIQ
jgi:hypothetical protein